MQASKPASMRRPPGHEHPVSHHCANHGDPHPAVPLAPIAATHRRGLDRYDFDSVLLPYKFVTMQYPYCAGNFDGAFTVTYRSASDQKPTIVAALGSRCNRGWALDCRMQREQPIKERVEHARSTASAGGQFLATEAVYLVSREL